MPSPWARLAAATATLAGGRGNDNGGTITGSYAEGTVSGNIDVGGLVGQNGGAITNAFAMGAVSGSSYDVGGLAGANDSGGTITNVYAVGSVSGTSNNIGGLVGDEQGTITNGYWDFQTSGQHGSAGATAGLTTAQLQSSLPNGFSSSCVGNGSGLFPYLLWQYPTGTPQSISGFAYTNGGVTALASTAAGAGYVLAL